MSTFNIKKICISGLYSAPYDVLHAFTIEADLHALVTYMHIAPSGTSAICLPHRFSRMNLFINYRTPERVKIFNLDQIRPKNTYTSFMFKVLR